MNLPDSQIVNLRPELLKDLFPDSASAEVEDLRRQLQELWQKRSYYTRVRRVVPATGFAVFIASLAAYYWLGWELPLAIGTFYLIVAIIFPLFDYAGGLDTEIEAIESEIALRKTGAEATEQRAERLFRSHGIDLRGIISKRSAIVHLYLLREYSV
jgi:hypothetical protein